MRPRVYFLPGYACTADIWRRCAESLADPYDTVSLSWPTGLTRHFHTVGHFSDWVRSQITSSPEDVLIGHSLGGLVALEVAQRSNPPGVRVVLVESFITPPGPFFRNLLMSSAPQDLVADINDMLEQERPGYSAKLREHLASLDVSAEVQQSATRIDAVYGDRGRNAAEVIASLGWTALLHDRINIHIVPNACHFPMLEQSAATAQILRAALNA